MTKAAIIIFLSIYCVIGVVWGFFAYEQQRKRYGKIYFYFIKKTTLAFWLNMFFWLIAMPIAFYKYKNVSDEFYKFMIEITKNENY